MGNWVRVTGYVVLPPPPARAVLAQVVVCEVMGVTLLDLCAEVRGDRQAAFARQIAMYLCRTVYGMTLVEIADCFWRDRTTVGHAVQRIEEIREDADFDAALSWLEYVVDRLAREGGSHG